MLDADRAIQSGELLEVNRVGAIDPLDPLKDWREWRAATGAKHAPWTELGD